MWSLWTFFSLEDREKLLTATFVPVLHFGNMIYLSALSERLQTLDTVLHPALRFVHGCNFFIHHCKLYLKSKCSEICALADNCALYCRTQAVAAPCVFAWGSLCGIRSSLNWNSVNRFFLQSSDHSWGTDSGRPLNPVCVANLILFLGVVSQSLYLKILLHLHICMCSI